MIFIDGKPEPIDRTYFRTRYGQNFPDLLPTEMNALVDACIQDVYTMFLGVSELWSRQLQAVYYNKTQMCYGLLLSWYIMDMYPEYSMGVTALGGNQIKKKSIGGVKIEFGNPDGNGISENKNYRDILAALKSNKFGSKAYMMIVDSAMMLTIRGRLK